MPVPLHNEINCYVLCLIHVNQHRPGGVRYGRNAVHLVHWSGTYPLPLHTLHTSSVLLWDLYSQVKAFP
jgi:hypothetical protein